MYPFGRGPGLGRGWGLASGVLPLRGHLSGLVGVVYPDTDTSSAGVVQRLGHIRRSIVPIMQLSLPLAMPFSLSR